jgi:hypothetical protein
MQFQLFDVANYENLKYVALPKQKLIYVWTEIKYVPHREHAGFPLLWILLYMIVESGLLFWGADISYKYFKKGT